LGVLATTYDVHRGLIEKRVMDLVLVLIELFSLGVTAEALRAKVDKRNKSVHLTLSYGIDVDK